VNHHMPAATTNRAMATVHAQRVRFMPPSALRRRTKSSAAAGNRITVRPSSAAEKRE
jgi:hypothetical protein